MLPNSVSNRDADLYALMKAFEPGPNISGRILLVVWIGLNIALICVGGSDFNECDERANLSVWMIVSENACLYTTHRCAR
jgi:hypothetical protein